MHLLPSWSYHALLLFPTKSNFILFVPPISASDNSMTMAEMSNILVKDFLRQPCTLFLEELSASNLS